jgi:hypothetical protein
MIIPHTDARYLRTPHLARADRLYAIAWEGERERLVRFELSGADVTSEEVVSEHPAIVALTRNDGEPKVTDDPIENDRARAGAYTVKIDRARGWSSVALEHGKHELRVWHAHGTAAAPAIALARGGVWIAFHHNVREDTGEPDLAKWIAVRFVTDDGVVLEPSADMIGRDRDALGEEQSFELPTIAVGADGAIAIFGRGSHTFWRQDLSSAGWTPRVALAPSEWGCRGRWVSVVRDGDKLVTARREKNGIELALLEAPTGGTPALKPVEVALPSRAHRGVPARPIGEDPAARDGRRTLFGDIHQHSAHSDGIGTADEPYLRARYAYGDDFAALTDHESFIGKKIGPGEWAYLNKTTERHDEPGVFATLFAYEWTGKKYPGPGHKVVYLPPSSGPIVSRDRVPEGRALIEAVKAQGGFAVPHHVGWTGADEEAHDPVGQPVWEICSCHGCYLHADHPLGARGVPLQDQMVEDVLKRGKRFGFIACSDGHGLLYHHGVGRKRDPFRSGLTAVQAKACTREAILDAIKERRCYATSGVPIYLDLRAGDHPMGSELTIDRSIEVSTEARCAVPIVSLSLHGPHGPIATVSGQGETYASLKASAPPGWVYARVEQADGEMAWSSPIFLDQKK